VAKHQNLFAVCPTWAQAVVEQELTEHGFRSIKVSRGGVYFKGHMGRANRILACPSRILWIQGTFKAHNFDELESGLTTLGLERHPGFEVHASCSHSALYHSDAVADRVRKLYPAGPVGLYVRIHKDNVSVSLDTSGERLNRRGWRLENGPAPMRETIAHCLLRCAQWSILESICDPMCGSGTFLIEAAVRAQGLTPGRLRTFTCDDWSKPGRGVDPRESEITCLGNDRDQRIIAGARRNAKRAQVSVTFSSHEATQIKAPAKTGLLVCNPPYGLRLKRGQAYETLGRILANEFKLWRAAIVCPNEASIKALGRKPVERIHFSMGGVPLILAILQPDG
jgi:putative N6-adenine-specific DNA methylase